MGDLGSGSSGELKLGCWLTVCSIGELCNPRFLRRKGVGSNGGRCKSVGSALAETPAEKCRRAKANFSTNVASSSTSSSIGLLSVWQEHDSSSADFPFCLFISHATFSPSFRRLIQRCHNQHRYLRPTVPRKNDAASNTGFCTTSTGRVSGGAVNLTLAIHSASVAQLALESRPGE